MGQREYINGMWGEKQNKRSFLKFGVLRTIQFDLIQIHTDFPENFYFSTARNYKFLVDFFEQPA